MQFFELQEPQEVDVSETDEIEPDEKPNNDITLLTLTLSQLGQ